jgi:hypothetical protein
MEMKERDYYGQSNRPSNNFSKKKKINTFGNHCRQAIDNDSKQTDNWYEKNPFEDDYFWK